MAIQARRPKIGEQPREWLPARRWLPQYQRRWLKGDLTAGAVVAALAIPQALGYATIAGLPVQVGLYSLPTVLLCYALLGTSRLLIVGPVSTVAVLTGSLIAQFPHETEAEAIAIGTGMAMAAGVLLMLASVLRIGWLAEFLSKPIVTGFVLGLTILVIIGELPNILGIPVPAGSVGDRIRDLLAGLDETNPATFAVGATALLLMFAGSRLAPRVPWALVTLVLGLVASQVLDLAADGVAVVGTVPQGLPTPSLPSIPPSQLADLVAAGAAIAFVGLAEGLSAARLFASGGGERIDANQELLAVGAGNLSSGLIGGFGVAGSLSKTATADRNGGRTQVTGLTTAALALATIVFLAPLLSALPKAVLSAIVIHAVWGLMDFAAMRRYARLRRNDIVAAVAATIGVLWLGPLKGLLLAIGLSVFGLVYRSSRIDVEVMGRVPGEKAAWGGMRNHPERRCPQGILVLRVDVPLFWVNAASVKDAVLARVDGVGAFYDEPIVAVVLDIEGTNQIDTTTIDMLDALITELASRGIDLYLVRVMFPVRQVLRNAGIVARIGEDHMWHSISQGVRESRIHHGLKEGVAEESGGYETPAEEHEERLVPTWFADLSFGGNDHGAAAGKGTGLEVATVEVATVEVPGDHHVLDESAADADGAEPPEPLAGVEVRDR
ncbi:MAG TPA: SulP family inorganic anion transporter [Candidatus Nanopelagicales bacterium]